MGVEIMIGPLRTRIANLVSRALARRVSDEGGIQALQVEALAGETREGCERIQQYGFTGVPLPGAEAVVLFVGGRRDHGLAVAVDDRRYRLKGLEGGEVAIYTDEGDTIVLRRGRKIEITSGAEVSITAPQVRISGDLQVTGSVQAGGSVQDGGGTMELMRSTFNSHTHAEHGDGGGVTSPPAQGM